MKVKLTLLALLLVPLTMLAEVKTQTLTTGVTVSYDTEANNLDFEGTGAIPPAVAMMEDGTGLDQTKTEALELYQTLSSWGLLNLATTGGSSLDVITIGSGITAVDLYSVAFFSTKELIANSEAVAFCPNTTKVTAGTKAIAKAYYEYTFSGYQLYQNKVYYNGFLFTNCDHTNLEHIPAHEATCLDPAIKECWYCNDCGSIFSDANAENQVTYEDLIEGTPLGHKMTYHQYVESTATSDGNYEYWSCDRCGHVFDKEDGSGNEWETLADAGENLIIPAFDPRMVAGNSRLFELVTSKDQIADGARYIIASMSDNGFYVMDSYYTTSLGCHPGIKSKMRNGKYVVINDSEFPHGEIVSGPLLLHAHVYENGGEMYLYSDNAKNKLLCGFGRYYTDLPTYDRSRCLPLAEYTLGGMKLPWDVTFDAANDWGISNAKGLFMRMEGDYPNTGGRKKMYSYICSGGDTFGGTDSPGSESGIMLFKEICHHTGMIEEIPAIAATCIAPGNQRMYYCTGCMHYFKDANCTTATTKADNILAQLGHEWADGTCSRCQAKSGMNEFSDLGYISSAYPDIRILVHQEGEKYYTLGFKPVEEGMEAVEVTCDEGYIKADTAKVYNTVDYNNSRLCLYNGMLRPIGFTPGQNSYLEDNYYDGSWYAFYNATDYPQFKCYTPQFYDNIAEAYDVMTQKTYDIVFKTTPGGTPYFGLQEYVDGDHATVGKVYNRECKHDGLQYTPDVAATCMEPSTMESYYCPLCYTYYSDAKCHHVTYVTEYQPEPALGHHYESGSDVCTNCGKNAGTYRPVTSYDQLNPGYYYMMIGHIGDQYYALSRPTYGVYPSDEELTAQGIEEANWPEMEYRDKMFRWFGTGYTATPITLNADGSVTANGNDMLEFSINCVRYYGQDIYDMENCSSILLRSPWGIINDGNGYYPCNTTFDNYTFENWKYVSMASECEVLKFTLADDTYKFSVDKISVEDNSMLMWRYYAGSGTDNDGTFILVKDGDKTYFQNYINLTDEVKESSTASLSVPKLYYCASKPMPHLNKRNAEVTVYAEEVDKDGLEEAIEDIIDNLPTEEEQQYYEARMLSRRKADAESSNVNAIRNLDLSKVGSVKASASDITSIISSKPEVSNNALVVLPAGSTLTGKNIVADGKCSQFVLEDNVPFAMPSAISSGTFTADRSSYTRETNDYNWGTVILPFPTTSNSDVQLYTISSVEGDVMTLEANNETVPAGTPCIFKRKSPTAQNVTFTAVNTLVTGETQTWSPITDWTADGTYTKLTDQMGMYFIAEDKFWIADEGITVNPFRATLSYSGSGARCLTIFANDGETTDILSIDANGQLTESAPIYTISGQKLGKTIKGLQIINGKKVIK